MKKYWMSLCFLTGSLLLAGCNFSLAQDITPPPDLTPQATAESTVVDIEYPLLPPSLQNGQKLYEKECASCHGISGKGDAADNTANDHPVVKEDGSSFTTSLTAWYNSITNHATNSTMPDFGNVLDDRERWNISSYLYYLNLPDHSFAAGKEVYDSSCIDCHGSKGRGDGRNAATLSGTPTDFTNEQVIAPKSDHDFFTVVTSGTATGMPAFDNNLTVEQRMAVISYLRSFSFSDINLPLPTTGEEASPSPSAETTATPAGESGTTSAPNETSVETIKVFGKVINDTGGSIPEGLTITLKMIDQLNETGSLTTAINPDGSYQFSEVPMNASRTLVASVEYENLVFNSEPSRLSEEEIEAINEGAPLNDVELDVHISESTTDLSQVSVDRLHVFFDFSRQGVVQVVELYLVSNNSGRTVVPSAEGGGILSFELPPDASNLQFQDSVIGERYLATENGFTDTAAIPPGEDSLQVLFAFDLPYEKKAHISLPIPYDIGTLIVMAPTEGVAFQSPQLVDEGNRAMQQSTFRVYSGTDFKANSTLDLTLSGDPSGQNSSVQGLQTGTVIVGAAILLLVLLSSGYYIYQRRKALEHIHKEAEEAEKLDKDSLMDAIIALDEQYKGGKISEKVYRQRRAELKEKLKRAL